MIDGYQAISLDSSIGLIDADVNWIDNDSVSNCKRIRFKVKDLEFSVSREDLTTMLIVLGEEQDIEKLIPMAVQPVKTYKTTLGFEWKASRDVRKGEVVRIAAPYTIHLPEGKREVYGANIKDKIKKTVSGIIYPNKN